MKLTEAEGKKLFTRYGIAIPRGVIVDRTGKNISIKPPLVVKAQTLSGNRRKEGGIFFARDAKVLAKHIKALLGKRVQGEEIKKVLVEEKINVAKEYYVSISYDTDSRAPVLALSLKGGIDLSKAKLFAIDMMLGVPQFFLWDAFKSAKFPKEDIRGGGETVQKLWKLFIDECALLAEINPLFKTKDNTFVAGDAKIILDDEKVNPGIRRFIEMEGDIAILASGGGASLLNIDALLKEGGRPANYTEYSGNPPAHVVTELTKRVLQKRGLKGCWVVGGTANFTDIYETLKGFVEGLRKVKPKPTYSIVIRRDGPRQKEAFEMLKEVGAKEGYRFYLFGSETPMVKTAKIMVKLAYEVNLKSKTKNPKP